jgi:hypothetical protein
MADEDGVIIDQLTDKHELLPFDPTDPDATQVVAVEHGGRTLEVIVPLLYDDTRIGEVVAAAVAGETMFVLCRHDRPLDESHGTLGLLVVAVPDRDGRYRAVIAHATYALEESTDEREGLGLFAAIPPGTGPERERRTGLDAILAFYRARPFCPFVIETTSGERFSVHKPDSIAFSPGWDAMILWSNPDRFTSIDPADITEVTRDDPEAIEPAPPAEVAVEDREELQADSRRLRSRIDGLEADIHRGDLGLKRAIHQGDLDLRSEIHRVDRDLRSEIHRGHLDHTGELALLKLRSIAHDWLLGVLFVVLIGGIFPTLWWAGTMDSNVVEHDRQLKRVEAASIKRHEAVDLRLDELKAAIRQADERSAPPR